MSVSIRSAGRRTTSAQVTESSPTKVFLWAVSLLTLASISAGLGRISDHTTVLIELALWAALVCIVDLIPVRVWGSVSVSMSFPVTLAAGMTFVPEEAALVAFIGSFDPRELQRGISLAKSVFNRSQVAASVMAGSAIFHAMGGRVDQWPDVLVPGAVALLTDAALNFGLVATAVAIGERLAPRRVLVHMFEASPWHYLVGYLVLGSLALPLAASVAVGGTWALALSLAPLVLTREMFRQTQHSLEAAERIRDKDRALRRATGDAFRERKDERLALAGELHDEILPPLFKVHLMGQVLKQDLAAGRLLELDEDLPELLMATDAAQTAVRDLLGDLRRSPLGAGGLLPTVQMLVSQLRESGSTQVHLEAEECESTALAQLLAYQVIREALHNAAKHARASSIVVRIWGDAEVLRVNVTDDGSGFVWSEVDIERHFGLQIMKERLEAAGGVLFVDAALGQGTSVVAAIPKDA